MANTMMEELRLRHGKIQAELRQALAEVEADAKADAKADAQTETEARDSRIGAGSAGTAAQARSPEGCAMLVACMANVIYATGRACDAFFYLPLEGAPSLFMRKPLGLRPEDVGGLEVAYVTKPEQIPGLLASVGADPPRALFIEDGQLSYAEAIRIKRAFGDAELLPGGSQLMRRARSVKTRFETDRLRETCARLSGVFERIPELYRPGMADAELGRSIEHELCRAGHLGIIRVFGRSMEVPSGGSLLTGRNATAQGAYDFAISGGGRDLAMPVGADGSPLEKGKTVLIDFACCANGYIGDMSRTFAIGDPPPEALEAHAAALEAQELVALAAKPGAICQDLYEIALNHAASRGLGKYFMGYGLQSKFVGHGVGLELNEMPILAQRIDTRLCEGMAVAIEPKFTLPGIGAVGVENTFIVTSDGLERLTLCPDDMATLPA